MQRTVDPNLRYQDTVQARLAVSQALSAKGVINLLFLDMEVRQKAKPEAWQAPLLEAVQVSSRRLKEEQGQLRVTAAYHLRYWSNRSIGTTFQKIFLPTYDKSMRCDNREAIFDRFVCWKEFLDLSTFVPLFSYYSKTAGVFQGRHYFSLSTSIHKDSQ